MDGDQVVQVAATFGTLIRLTFAAALGAERPRVIAILDDRASHGGDQGALSAYFTGVPLFFSVPWNAINLVDYYLVRRGRYDVAPFFTPDGICGRIQ